MGGIERGNEEANEAYTVQYMLRTIVVCYYKREVNGDKM